MDIWPDNTFFFVIFSYNEDGDLPKNYTLGNAFLCFLYFWVMVDLLWLTFFY